MKETNFSWPGWETGKVLGRGGYSTVYEISRNTTGQQETAALKVITIPETPDEVEELLSNGHTHSSVTARFQEHKHSIVKEYNLMASLKGHPNIVYCDDILTVAHDDGIGWDIFIKMELLKPLNKALPQDIAQEDVIQVGRDICNALAVCKHNGILHRDIKPQNIFQGRGGNYKLGDFGVARTTGATAAHTNKVGTYSYMAPEVYKGEAYGHRADVYSLGLVLYWMLNLRRLPFQPLPPEIPTVSMEQDALQKRISGEPLPEPATGSKALKAIVLKACAYDPKDRYASAGEMMEDLLSLSDHTSGMFTSWEEQERRRLEAEKARLKRQEEEALERMRQEEERKRREEEERKRKEAEERRRREEEERRRREEEEGRQLIKTVATAVGVALVVIALGFGVIKLLKGKPTASTPPTAATQPVIRETTPPATLPPATQSTGETLADGWYYDGSYNYFYLNGKPITGWLEDGGYNYYFLGNGQLAQNTTLEIDDYRYTFDGEGHISGKIPIRYSRLDGNWSDSQFHFGDTSGTEVWVYYKELDTPVKNCTSLTMNVEVTDDGGGNVGGDWTLCLRINGHWKRLDEFEVYDYSDGTGFGMGFFTFSEPVTFDAFTAYRTAGVTETYYCNLFLTGVEFQ